MKVRIEVDDKYIHRFHSMLACAPNLESAGITLGRDVEAADLVIAQESLFRERPEQMAQFRDRPLAIYERIGCAPVNVKASVRALLKRKNVLAWMKETSFVDLQLNNEPMVDGRYHLKLLLGEKGDHAAIPQKVNLSADDLGKIVHIFPIHMQERYDYLKSLNTRTLRKRSYDVFFAGTMNYASTLVDEHRLTLVNRLANLPHKCLIATGNVFTQNTFQDNLIQAKIFVSPYGSGTYSWKDFEAIFAGCILIKPKADFISHYGFPIYEPGKYCIQCNPDFSDLDQIVHDVLNNLESHAEFAARAQAALFAACDLEGYARDLQAFFEKFDDHST